MDVRGRTQAEKTGESDPAKPARFLLGFIAAALAVLAVVGPRIDGPASAAVNATIRTWAPTFMIFPITLTMAESVSVAKQYDVIVAAPGSFQGRADEMKQANPDLIMLAYVNGAYSLHDDGTAWPESWYAHDAQGEKIIALGHPNTAGDDYLMNVANPEWRQQVARFCKEALERSQYQDGCLVDSLGGAEFFPGYASGIPVKPTGDPWTKGEWLQLNALTIQHVQLAGVGIVVPNGVHSGPAYYNAQSPSSVLLDHADGGMVEVFVRAQGSPLDFFRSELEWKKDVDMIRDIESDGKFVYAVTKTWTSGTQAEKDAVHEFALGTFLLGTNGRSHFVFLYERNQGDVAEDAFDAHPWWETDLGAPLAAYAKEGGIYTRNFGKGRVLVNPTTTTVTVALARSYRRLDGRLVSTVTLGPHTAAVLRNATSPSSSGPSPSLSSSPSPSPTPTQVEIVIHERSISVDAGTRRIRGKVKVADDFGRCYRDVVVKLQRRSGGRWATARRKTTDEAGRYAFSNAKRLRGRYRTVASRFSDTSGVEVHRCTRAASSRFFYGN